MRPMLQQCQVTSVANIATSNVHFNLCAGLEMRENEAYTALSETQESFEMSKSICYAATEQRI